MLRILHGLMMFLCLAIWLGCDRPAKITTRGQQPGKQRGGNTGLNGLNTKKQDFLRPTMEETLRWSFVAREGNPDFAKMEIGCWNAFEDQASVYHSPKQLSEFESCDIVFIHQADYQLRERYRGSLPGRWNVFFDSRGPGANLIFVTTRRFLILDVVGSLRNSTDDPNRPDRKFPFLAVQVEDIPSGQKLWLVSFRSKAGYGDSAKPVTKKFLSWVKKESAENAILAYGFLHAGFAIESENESGALTALTEKGNFRWVRPQTISETFFLDENGDGKDDNPGFVSDFFLAGGKARKWKIDLKNLPFQEPEENVNPHSIHRPIHVSFVPDLNRPWLKKKISAKGSDDGINWDLLFEDDEKPPIPGKSKLDPESVKKSSRDPR